MSLDVLKCDIYYSQLMQTHAIKSTEKKKKTFCKIKDRYMHPCSPFFLTASPYVTAGQSSNIGLVGKTTESIGSHKHQTRMDTRAGKFKVSSLQEFVFFSPTRVILSTGIYFNY